MKRKTYKKGRRRRAALNLLGTLLLVAVILLCIPVTVPRLFGYQVYNVLTGSMDPAIPAGSLVYVKAAEPSGIEPGDVIVFYSSVDSGAIITHRVVENHTVSGEFITKGDANAQEDPLPVEYEMLLGRVELSIPRLGGVLSMLVTTDGKLMVACMIGAAVILFILAGCLNRTPPDRIKSDKQ